VIEDVENNKSLKEVVKSRLAESKGNLKRKAKEKISSLMRESGYRVGHLAFEISTTGYFEFERHNNIYDVSEI